MKMAIENAAFRPNGDQVPIVTDIYWPHDELYREGEDNNTAPSATENRNEDNGGGEDDDGKGA